MTDMTARGTSRFVFFLGRWAFKVPRFYSWKTLLWGLLANMQEREFGATGWPELCPVLWSMPGGWLVVMPKCRVLSESEFAMREGTIALLIEPPDGYRVPAEMKHDSWGWLGNRLVAVDYG